MKKILFCVRDFSTGGVQKSLVNLLKELDPLIKSKQLVVDVFVLKKIGELLTEIPQSVNVIEADESMWKFGTTSGQAKKLGLKFFLKRSFYALKAKLFSNKNILKKSLAKQRFIGEYDAVISYAVSISGKSLYAGWAEAAFEKTKSPNKIVYIHNDFVASGLNNPYTVSLLEKFDKILFVSKSCQKNFCEKFDYLKNKTDFLYNIIDVDDILKKADEQIDLNLDKTKLNFVSISRLSREKAHIRTLNVLNKLNKEGFDFCWHVLGDGPMKPEIQNTIKKFNLENKVKLYGNQTNPYKFLKQMDFLYLGSHNESFGLVLVDSMILGMPVVTTNTISANEIIGGNGLVCENNENAIYELFKNLFSKKQKLISVKNYNYDNAKIKEKFLQMI